MAFDGPGLFLPAGNHLLTQGRDKDVLLPVHAGNLPAAIFHVNLNSPMVKPRPGTAVDSGQSR
jgi:hypothetical protein